MRVRVSGNSPAALALAGDLRTAGYLVTDEFPSYRVSVQDAPGDHIVVDTPDARFGRLVTHRIGELAPDGGVFVQVKDGNQDDKAVVITVPTGRDDYYHAVEVGVRRALDQTTAKPASSLVTGLPVGTGAGSMPSGELFANLAQVIKDHQQEVFGAIAPALAAVRDQGATIDARLTAVGQRQTDVTTAVTTSVSTILHLLSDTASQIRINGISDRDLLMGKIVASESRLFSDLMAYYTRRRWWQVWRR